MTGFLGTFLTAELQSRGICSDDYRRISEAVTGALLRLNRQMGEGETIELPTGRTLTAGRRIRAGKGGAS